MPRMTPATNPENRPDQSVEPTAQGREAVPGGVVHEKSLNSYHGEPGLHLPAPDASGAAISQRYEKY